MPGVIVVCQPVQEVDESHLNAKAFQIHNVTGEVPSKGCGELAFKRGGVGDDEHIIVFFAIVKQDQMMCLGSFFRHTLVIFAGGFLLIHLFLLMDGLMEAVALCRYLLLHAQWVNRR